MTSKYIGHLLNTDFCLSLRNICLTNVAVCSQRHILNVVLKYHSTLHKYLTLLLLVLSIGSCLDD